MPNFMQLSNTIASIRKIPNLLYFYIHPSCEEHSFSSSGEAEIQIFPVNCMIICQN